MDIPTCITLADNALNEGQPQAACEFYEVALKQQPDNVEVLEAYGEVLLHHMQDPARAIQLLQHAARLCPSEGHVKFLNLAQLHGGHEALGYYGKALGILNSQLCASRRRSEKEELRRSIAEARAAIAELYLTDLCDEPEAEQRCEDALAEAVRNCEECVEVHQTLGSLRLSQLRNEDALVALRRAVELSHELEEGLQPAYETRVELGKLLMQVCHKDAFGWLQSVLYLNPHNAYVWFLLGETARLRQRFHDSARLLRHARLAAPQDDPEAIGQIDEAIRLLVQDMGGPDAVAAVPHMDAPNPLDFIEQSDDDEDGEWEDADESDDDDVADA